MVTSRHSVQLVYIMFWLSLVTITWGCCCQQICSVAVDFDKDFVPLATGGANQSNVIRLHTMCMSCHIIINSTRLLQTKVLFRLVDSDGCIKVCKITLTNWNHVIFFAAIRPPSYFISGHTDYWTRLVSHHNTIYPHPTGVGRYA